MTILSYFNREVNYAIIIGKSNESILLYMIFLSTFLLLVKELALIWVINSSAYCILYKTNFFEHVTTTKEFKLRLLKALIIEIKINKSLH